MRTPKPRGRAQPLTAVSKQIIGLKEQGYSSKQVADLLDLDASFVSQTVYRLRQRDYLPRFSSRARSHTLYEAAKRQGVVAGTMVDISGSLQPETVQWLVTNTPAGVTVAAFIGSIVTDAHQEEVHGL